MAVQKNIQKKLIPKDALYLVLPNIRSLHNLGSIFRTADAAGVSKIILTGYTGDPQDPKAAKVALGAEQWVKWERRVYTAPVLKKLKKQGFDIIALERTAKSIDFRKFKPRFPVAVVLGNEVDGIKDGWQNLADAIVHLPMRGMKESLNVSVAWGVFAYALRFGL